MSESNELPLRPITPHEWATWLALLPEFEDPEDRRWLVNDLDRVDDHLHQAGKLSSHLPRLDQEDKEDLIWDLESWLENALRNLKVELPTPDEDQTETELVQNVVDLLLERAIPTADADEWRR